jgi:hypothetical protein
MAEKKGDQIQASQTIAGHRYMTAKGVVVEIAASVQGSKTPGQATMPRLDHSRQITAYPVLTDGTVDKAHSTSIPATYVLGVGVKGKGFPKPGRKPLPKSLWRGRARDSVVPNSLMLLAKENGCYAHEATHYFLIGYEGRSVFAIFRNGTLGFHKKFENADFDELKVEDIGGRFMPYRVPVINVIKDRERVFRVAKYVIAQAKDGKNG